MNVAGIIAEYNPFHNGHQYHIEQTRRLTNADYCIAVISGDFVQRGAPALLDKYVRTEMALKNGIDLVIALPIVCSTANAGIFARSGIEILSALGVVTDVSFGCEADNTKEKELLLKITDLLRHETEIFQQVLLKELAKGQSYPAARMEALTACFSREPEEAAMVKHLLSGPNNILALEYLQAISETDPSISACMVPRKGASYHAEELSDDLFPSASSLRPEFLSDHQTPDSLLEKISPWIPANIIPLLSDYLKKSCCLSEKDFSDLLFFALQREKSSLRERFSQNPELAGTVLHHLESFRGWQDFVLTCKSKNITYTSVSRFLTQVLLGIDANLLSAAKDCLYAPYARILGFRRDAAPLLSAIQKNTSVPVITKPADALKSLPGPSRSLFETDLTAGDLYTHAASKDPSDVLSELRHPLVYL